MSTMRGVDGRVQLTIMWVAVFTFAAAFGYTFHQMVGIRYLQGLGGSRGLGSVVPATVGLLAATIPLGSAMGGCALCAYASSVPSHTDRKEQPGMTSLHTAIGRYKHTEALFDDPMLRMEAFPVINRAFAPMVRTECFDVSEMAIATFLMARAAGSDLVLLPVVLAARFQNAALLRRKSDGFGPDDLRGRRVGIRAYSQTTALWLRGTLEDEHGVPPSAVRWVTFEGAHVASFQDPPWTERAAAGSDMLAMLRAGDLDAAIFGNDLPAAADLATVFPDPDGAGQRFLARHHFMPVNHMVVVRAEIARRADVVQALLDRFRTAGNPFPSGRSALDPAIRLAVRYATAQGLLPRALTSEEVWAGLPPGLTGQDAGADPVAGSFTP